MTYIPPVGAMLFWLIVLAVIFGPMVLITWPEKGKDYGGSPLPSRNEPVGAYFERRQTRQSNLDYARRVGDTRWAAKLEAQMKAEGMRIDPTPGHTS